ncbi:MAG: GAF domain-containing sensor histidine kinase [Candidatus Eremiobacteraeota bacterium]|nr:GAF domain-containing sensor histidine kinase [Candidatus Eremiobacteraeota bacterium]
MAESDPPPQLPPAVLEKARETGLLDTDPEEAFDRLTALASRLAGAPTALLTILDKDRQFFKAQVGLEEPWRSKRETPWSHSFCKFVAATNEALVVGDAREHPWLCQSPAITDLGVVAYCGVPLADSEGVPVGALCVIDSEPRSWQAELPELLAELARSAMTEVELRKQSQALLELTQRQNEVLGTVAHDLRTPLTVVEAFSRMLLDPRFGLDDQPRSMVEAVRRSGSFMVRLVDDLLDLQALKSGRVNLSLERVNLGSLVVGVVELQTVAASLKEVEIDFEGHPKPVWVQADPRKLEQVVQNLMANAIKFSPPNTRVKVTLSAGPKVATLKVTDQGPGVPVQDQQKVFEPFAKSVAMPTGGEKSTGLGLTIVKRLVEAHGGRVGIDSQGAGATFWVELPRPKA